MRAEFVLTLCDRWHKLPEDILNMDASTLRIIRIGELGGYFDKGQEAPE